MIFLHDTNLHPTYEIWFSTRLHPLKLKPMKTGIFKLVFRDFLLSTSIFPLPCSAPGRLTCRKRTQPQGTKSYNGLMWRRRHCIILVPRTAITNHHELGGLKQKLILIVLETKSLKSRDQLQGRTLPRLFQFLGSRCSSVCGCVTLISPSVSTWPSPPPSLRISYNNTGHWT